MLGMQTNFIATIGTVLDTVERGGEPRHSLRAAIRMPKRRKDDPEYPTQWVTLNIRESAADYVRERGSVGNTAAVTGRLRTNEGDGRTFLDVDVSEITIFPKAAKSEAATGGPDW